MFSFRFKVLINIDVIDRQQRFRCGKEGHMSYDCPEKFNQQNRNQKSTSYAAKVNNVAVETIQ